LGQIPSSLDGYWGPRSIIDWDPVGLVLQSGKFFLRLGEFPTAFVLGISDDSVVGVVEANNPVTSFPYTDAINRGYDRETYSSPLSGLFGTLRSLLASGQGFSGSTNHENFARHETMTGFAAGSMQSIFNRRYSFYAADHLFETDYNLDNVVKGGGMTHDGYFTPVVDHTDSGIADVQPFFDFLSKDGVTWQFNVGAYLLTSTVTDFVYRTGLKPSISYRLSLGFNLYGLTSLYVVDVAYHYNDLQFCVDADPISGFRNSFTFGDVSASWQMVSLDNVYGIFGTTLLSGSASCGPAFTSLTRYRNTAFDPIDKIYQPLSSWFWPLSGFSLEVGHRQWDICCSAYQSTTDAADNLGETIQSRLGYRLAQLASWGVQSGVVLNDISGFPRVGDVSRDDINTVIKRLRGIADPSYSRLLSELVDIDNALRAVMTQFDSHESSWVTHGSFDFDFPSGTFGRESVHLKTRTKIVLKSGLYGLTRALLGKETFDLLVDVFVHNSSVPLGALLSRLSGITASLRAIGSTLFLESFPIVLVHSFVVTSPVTELELSSWGLSNLSVEPIELRVYHRGISLVCPLPRSCKFDFSKQMSISDVLPIILLRSLLASVQSHL